MKVLHVTQTTGGVETSLLLLFRHLDRTRFTLHLACPPALSLAAEARALGIKVFEIPMVRSAHPFRDAVALLRLAALMRREQYDIVHGHSAKGGYLARLAARLAGRAKTIYHPRAFSYLSQRGLVRRFFLELERLAVPLTNLVIAASESERQRAVQEVRVPESRVTVIPNSVDFAEAAGFESPNGREPPVVLTVGRLSYQKNPEMFVRVAALVAKRRPDVRFQMAGGGFASPLEERVRSLIRDVGMEGRIEIRPWTTKQDALRTLARCGVFVLTSRFEGMPNTLLEALMLAKPAVVTDVGGSRDVVVDGVGGYTVPLDDDAVMAARIIELLDDKALAAKVAEAGWRRALAQFDIRKNVRTLEAIYQALGRQ
jgi:glycosyltransferase involved in cell wall biosynthesis